MGMKTNSKGTRTYCNPKNQMPWAARVRESKHLRACCFRFSISGESTRNIAVLLKAGVSRVWKIHSDLRVALLPEHWLPMCICIFCIYINILVLKATILGRTKLCWLIYHQDSARVRIKEEQEFSRTCRRMVQNEKHWKAIEDYRNGKYAAWLNTYWTVDQRAEASGSVLLDRSAGGRQDSRGLQLLHDARFKECQISTIFWHLCWRL